MKTLAQVLFIAAPFLIMGQEANSSKRFANSIELNIAQENAWAAITDFSTFNMWDDNVVDVRCSTELKKREYCQVIVETGEIIDVEIVELVENESYTLRHKLSSGNVYIRRDLALQSPLKLSETVWYKGISKKTFEKYKGTTYNEFLKNRLEQFKKYMENEPKEGQ